MIPCVPRGTFLLTLLSLALLLCLRAYMESIFHEREVLSSFFPVSVFTAFAIAAHIALRPQMASNLRDLIRQRPTLGLACKQLRMLKQPALQSSW